MHIRSIKKHAGDIHLQDLAGKDLEGNRIRIEDRIPDDSEAVEDAVGIKLQIIRLRDVMLKVLRGKEKRVIEMRYGLDGQDELTQKEIAEELGISRSYVSRIEKKALSRLNEEMQE